MSTKQKTEEKVFSFMEEHHMLETHDRVVAGVSGGADSVCLLFVLLAYQSRVPFSLAVVHVNHCIREEADSDARYVEALCRERQVPFYSYTVDVRQLAKQEKCSDEEAGRNARYQAFARAAQDFHANKIAVAHNCNDRSETMLFHLFRGSGIRGLGSIRPVRDNIIRPILCLERKEVEAYLGEQGITYCQDVTNEKDDYTRNRIRHHILPYAEKEIVSGCVSHMARTADMLWEAEDYLKQQTMTAMEECVQEDEAETTIDINSFLRKHTVIQKRILYEVITSLSGSDRDITRVHIQDLRSLFTESGNRILCLPRGIVARRQYDKVILERRDDWKEEDHSDRDGRQAREPDDRKTVIIPIQELGEECLGEEAEKEEGDLGNNGRLLCRIPWKEEEIELRLLSVDGISSDFPQNQYTKWLDYGKIVQSLELRTRQTGDYLTIAGKDGEMVHKSIKDYMITEKIPRNERDKIPLIAEGHHVIWLMGYRISEYYKINRNTKHVLQVQLIGRSCGGSKTEEKNG